MDVLLIAAFIIITTKICFWLLGTRFQQNPILSWRRACPKTNPALTVRCAFSDIPSPLQPNPETADAGGWGVT